MNRIPTRQDLDDLYEREQNVHKKAPGRTQAKELPEDICTCGPQCEEPCDGKCGCPSCRGSYGALIGAVNTMTEMEYPDGEPEAPVPSAQAIIKERLYGQPEAAKEPKKRGRPKKQAPKADKTAAQLWDEAMGS